MRALSAFCLDTPVQAHLGDVSAGKGRRQAQRAQRVHQARPKLHLKPAPATQQINMCSKSGVVNSLHIPLDLKQSGQGDSGGWLATKAASCREALLSHNQRLVHPFSACSCRPARTSAAEQTAPGQPDLHIGARQLAPVRAGCCGSAACGGAAGGQVGQQLRGVAEDATARVDATLTKRWAVGLPHTIHQQPTAAGVCERNHSTQVPNLCCAKPCAKDLYFQGS